MDGGAAYFMYAHRNKAKAYRLNFDPCMPRKF